MKAADPNALKTASPAFAKTTAWQADAGYNVSH